MLDISLPYIYMCQLYENQLDIHYFNLIRDPDTICYVDGVSSSVFKV